MPDPMAESDDAPAPAGGNPQPAGDAHPRPPAGAAGASMPEYKGEPLDAERGPGLGCFWIQVALLAFFLVLTPLTVTWGWDSRISGVLLILTLVLLLFTGQTIIFLLRLVAADRRSRRAPLSPTAKPTVGQMEDASRATGTSPPSGDPSNAESQEKSDG